MVRPLGCWPERRGRQARGPGSFLFRGVRCGQCLGPRFGPAGDGGGGGGGASQAGSAGSAGTQRCRRGSQTLPSGSHLCSLAFQVMPGREGGVMAHLGARRVRTQPYGALGTRSSPAQ